LCEIKYTDIRGILKKKYIYICVEVQVC